MLDMVAVFGETTGELALKQLKHKMMQDKDGRRILRCVCVFKYVTYFVCVLCWSIEGWAQIEGGVSQAVL